MNQTTHEHDTVGFFYTNANGLYNKVDELKHRVNDSNSKVVIITETMLTEDIRSVEIGLPNFSVFRGDRATQSKGGGSCIYVHNSMSACVMSDFVPNDCVAVRISILPTPIIVFCVYRSPSQNITDRMSMANQLNVFLNSISGDEIIIVAGDFNFPKIRWHPESVNPAGNCQL